ncbi:MAG: hypothetical protein ACYDC5_06050 [Candidatus Dormibacteria bacterium]
MSFGLACLVSGCGFTATSTAAPGVVPTSVPSAVQAGTGLTVTAGVWGGVGRLEPPTSTTCSADSTTVTVRGSLGLESVVVKLTGLARGRKYTFVPFQAPVPPTVTLTETGPIPLSSSPGQPYTDVLGPSQGLEADGSGHISVAPNGQSGSLAVSLPGDDLISGSWRCGSAISGTTGVVQEPALQPATVPPVVNECFLMVATLAVPPLQCPSGDLNIAAWDDYRGSTVAELGASPTLRGVEAAICHDQSTYSLPRSELQQEYSLAALYYGWHFRLAPAAVVADARCAS